MAKRKNTEEGQETNDNTQIQDISNETINTATAADNEDRPETETPPGVSEILKSFTTYENLYVDKQGGVYTSDTPEPIRGKAILYKNPHYKN